MRIRGRRTSARRPPSVIDPGDRSPIDARQLCHADTKPADSKSCAEQPSATLLQPDYSVHCAQLDIGWLVGVVHDGYRPSKSVIKTTESQVEVLANFIGIYELAYRRQSLSRSQGRLHFSNHHPEESTCTIVGNRTAPSDADDRLGLALFHAHAPRTRTPGPAMVNPITRDGDALLGELTGSGHPSYTSTRRVFRIIDRVSNGGERLTVKSLAHDLGISVSTCYHLIGILVDEGYIEKLPHHAGYRLGPTIGVLFERSRRSGSAAVVEPVLHDLARIADRTAYFAVLSGTDDVIVTHAHSPPDSSPVGVPQGFTGPSYALALGKVLIAAGGSAAINRYLEQHELRAFTRRTITDPTKLEAHLKEVRTRGYATDFEEFAKNLYCVAVPVSDDSGTVAGAVGLATTATSPADELKRLIRLTRRAAAQISTALRGESRTPAFEGLF